MPMKRDTKLTLALVVFTGVVLIGSWLIGSAPIQAQGDYPARDRAWEGRCGERRAAAAAGCG